VIEAPVRLQGKRIAQPRDGSCLFHALIASMALAESKLASGILTAASLRRVLTKSVGVRHSRLCSAHTVHRLCESWCEQSCVPFVKSVDGRVVAPRANKTRRRPALRSAHTVHRLCV
jgi:hypothetical protein